MSAFERPSRSHNLPSQATPLIGREREVESVTRRLLSPEVRLLTLTGPGGIGKSRLALAVAGQVLNQFPDGVFFVPLAPIRDPALVCSTIAQTLDLREMGAKPVFEMVQDYLRDRAMLLLLDNFEQVVAAAPHLASLLQSCPGLKLLVTSREALRLSAEHQFDVPSLGLPETAPSVPVERLAEYEAVRLFVERAQAVKPDFALTAESAAATAEICRRLDGLPLAIQLAAARVRVFSPQALLARMAPRLKLLTGGARDVPERQQTMRDTIAWSYDLLTKPEQRLFRRLSVFAGGCTPEAAEAVCVSEGDLGIEVMEGLESLVGKSLLRAEETGSAPRFLMLETIREYGQECLAASGEAEALTYGHARFLMVLARRSFAESWSANQLEWMERLEEEVDNFRGALRWALSGGDPEVGLRLVGSMEQFWWTRGMIGEARVWVDQALAATSPAPSPARAWALYAAGDLCARRGDYTLAVRYADEALAMHRQFGNKMGIVVTAWFRGYLAISEGEYSLARSWLEESLALSGELNFGLGIGLAFFMLGHLAFYENDHVLARRRLEESLAVLRGVGERRSIGQCLLVLAWHKVERREFETVQRDLTEIFVTLREGGDRFTIIVFGIFLPAFLAADQGQAVRAARLFGAIEGLSEMLGMPANRVIYDWPDLFQRDKRKRRVTAVRSALGEEAFAKAWAEGMAMSFDEAFEYALAEEPPADVNPVDASPLTRREREIATLIAQGLANREIAAQLVISERTVETHLTNIMGKLEFNSRSQVAVWAARHLA